MERSDSQQKYPWTYRRAIVIATLVLCGAGLAYLTLKGGDTRLNETLAFGYFALAGSVIGTYVFGAVWHDRGLMAQPPAAKRASRRQRSVDTTREEDGSDEDVRPVKPE